MKRTLEEYPQNRIPSRRRSPAVRSGEGVAVKRAVTINLPAAELYAFWRNLENLPTFMTHVDSVVVKSPTLSHWTIRAGKDHTMEWDAEIIEDRREEVIAWRSLPGSEVDNAGSVWFSPAPGERGTVVKVSLRYSPPGGKIGAQLAKWFGQDADALIAEDLFRLKALLETGEIPTIEGQPKGDTNSKD
jgi:uncharacterized membrane protein